MVEWLNRIDRRWDRVIRLLVADDHGIVREGLGLLFAAVPDVELVGTAADGREAVALADQTTPDVVLMDVVMPQVDGVEAARRITAAHPACRIVMLTAHGDQPTSGLRYEPARPDKSSRTPRRLKSSGRSRPRTPASPCLARPVGPGRRSGLVEAAGRTVRAFLSALD